MSVDSLVERIDGAKEGIETSREMIEDARELTASVRNTESYGIRKNGQWVECRPENVEETTNEDGNLVDDTWDSLKNFQAMMERNKDGEVLQSIHTGLSFLGVASNFIPVAGPIIGVAADGINAGLYLLEGEETQAAMAAASMVPGLGELKAGASLAKAGGNLLKNSKLLNNSDKFVQIGKSVDTELEGFKDFWNFGTGSMELTNNTFQGVNAALAGDNEKTEIATTNAQISALKTFISGDNLVRSMSAFA